MTSTPRHLARYGARRNLIVAVSAMLALAGAAVAALPGRSAARDTSTVPGGYSSWAALFTVQDKMNTEAELIRDVPGQSRASGLAGVIAAPEQHTLMVHWHGVPSPELEAVLAKSAVPVDVRPAPCPANELQAQANRIVAREALIRCLAGGRLLSRL